MTRLQLALDAPGDFAHLARLAPHVDVVEVCTPLLKRFGVAAVTTAIELAPGLPILADAKTVDAGAIEAALVLGAGASQMTVLSSASRATLEAVAAATGGIDVVVDTITERSDVALLEAVAELRARRLIVSLAGGLSPATLDAAVATGADVVVVGSAITTDPDPEGVAAWMHDRIARRS